MPNLRDVDSLRTLSVKRLSDYVHQLLKVRSQQWGFLFIVISLSGEKLSLFEIHFQIYLKIHAFQESTSRRKGRTRPTFSRVQEDRFRDHLERQCLLLGQFKDISKYVNARLREFTHKHTGCEITQPRLVHV